jgi:hypothetical protein
MMRHQAPPPTSTLSLCVLQLRALQALSNDPSLATKLLPLLTKPGSPNSQLLINYIKQWQQALQKQMEQERELAKKKQRPVWRCRVCGRYGCPVAPYIERYEEVP